MRITALYFLFALFAQQVSAQQADQLLQSVFDFHRKVESVQMDLLMNERIGERMVRTHNFLKVEEKPFRVYLRQQSPVDGLEILYPSVKDASKALVYPAAFPWTTLQLEPLGPVMRKDYHHSVFKSGYGFILGVLQHLYTKYQNDIDNMAKVDAIVNYDGVLCYKVMVDIPDFRFTDYTVQHETNLENLANTLKVSDYMLLEHNSALSFGRTISAGTKLRVPADYGKQFILYIAKETFMLTGIKVFDNIGLFEEYTYRNVRINPTFSPDDFLPDNPSYRF